MMFTIRVEFDQTEVTIHRRSTNLPGLIVHLFG